MNEKERIIQIMNAEGYTYSKFAEEIGIQRAAVSHIINGRNNLSLDIAKKILARFTNINPDWLLSGTGSMKRGGNTTVNPIKEEPDLFTNVSPTPPKEAKPFEYQKEYHPDTGRKKTVVPNNPLPNPPVVKELLAVKETPGRRIMRIMIFYSDSTFETFQPEKQE
ncbi:MAG: helix-turn-helix domain-containing protein [Tannerella sp.]|jgi:transcriptional regulator with XRE-family HTH domain|nr:helix-turn-helix domain-containing protein [Tannerella sp.]